MNKKVCIWYAAGFIVWAHGLAPIELFALQRIPDFRGQKIVVQAGSVGIVTALCVAWCVTRLFRKNVRSLPIRPSTQEKLPLTEPSGLPTMIRKRGVLLQEEARNLMPSKVEGSDWRARLLSNGGEVNMSNPPPFAYDFLHAALVGCYGAVQTGGPYAQYGESLEEPIIRAIRRSDVKGVAACLVMHSDAARALTRYTGASTLHTVIDNAMSEREKIPLIHLLLDNGAEVDYQRVHNGHCFQSPLMRALYCGQYNVANELIRRGAGCRKTHGQDHNLTVLSALWEGAVPWVGDKKAEGYEERIKNFLAIGHALIRNGANPQAVMKISCGGEKGKPALFPHNTILGIVAASSKKCATMPREILDFFINQSDVAAIVPACPHPALVAAYHGNILLLRLLQITGAPPRVTWKGGKTRDWRRVGLPLSML